MKSKNSHEAKLSEAFKEGFKQENFFQSVKREFKELQDFYLDEDRKARLVDMNMAKRSFWTFVWLLKLMFLKLNPLRRLILLIGLLLSISSTFTGAEGSSGSFGINSHILGPLILLFVLMLELKDKLLARDELEAGRRVQIALMPDRMPQVQGWDIWLYTRPANDVGGDLVDFYCIDEETCGVALGDVSGKGLEAALFMAKLQATIRAFLTEFSTLSKLAEKINSIFHRDSLPNKFASIIFTEFQKNSNSVKLLNAGHMPPLIIRGKNIEELDSHAPAFGLMSEASFETREVLINEQDFLILYSDGVTETMNEDGVFFGDDRLREILLKHHDANAQNMGESIIREIAQFKKEAPFFDDISLAVLQRKQHHGHGD
ncbi:MAG: hypothetical protein DWQ05_12935 [Calditrichaeota bacterium]|nr:MAG: hypothetical protein DWQ05_12935 [Calditrichota bacterium]